MAKAIGSKMKEFDTQDLLLPEINLMKYINQKVMWKFLPRNVQRMVEALVAKGEYILDGVILRKVGGSHVQQDCIPVQQDCIPVQQDTQKTFEEF